MRIRIEPVNAQTDATDGEDVVTAYPLHQIILEEAAETRVRQSLVGSRAFAAGILQGLGVVAEEDDFEEISHRLDDVTVQLSGAELVSILHEYELAMLEEIDEFEFNELRHAPGTALNQQLERLNAQIQHVLLRNRFVMQSEQGVPGAGRTNPQGLMEGIFDMLDRLQDRGHDLAQVGFFYDDEGTSEEDLDR